MTTALRNLVFICHNTEANTPPIKPPRYAMGEIVLFRHNRRIVAKVIDVIYLEQYDLWYYQLEILEFVNEPVDQYHTCVLESELCFTDGNEVI